MQFSGQLREFTPPRQVEKGHGGAQKVFADIASTPRRAAMTPTPLPLVVQAVCRSLALVLPSLLRDRTLASVLGDLDRPLAESVLEGARQAFERWLEARLGAPPAARAIVVHSALGRLALRADAPEAFAGAGLRHGCTPAVREQAAFFVAQGTAREARQGMALFRASVPSESTIKRVATEDGAAFAALWREHAGELARPTLEALGPEVALVSVSADGAMVPMRHDKPATRAWREARLCTVTLYAKPDPTRPREVTVHDERGEPSRERVGLERERLATFVVAAMPTAGGPKGSGARRALSSLLDAVRAGCPGARLSGVCDGGEWPERTVDRAVGCRRRTTDFYHATEHVRAASVALLGDGPASLRWYRRRRTRLLRSNGAAEQLADELEAAAERTTLHAARRKALRTEAGFFRKRRRQMRYASALARDEPIGSGVMEAAVKQMIAMRMKRPGASWTETGGQAVLALRCVRLSGVWNQAWKRHRDNERRAEAVAA